MPRDQTVRQCRRGRDKMASFAQNEDMVLIDLIRQNPVLYNMELADYKDGALKEHIWGEIAAALNKSTADIKRRWKYMRDSYSRCKRKNKSRTGYAALKTTKWVYFEPLQFLEGNEIDAPENSFEVKIKTDDSPDEDSQQEDDENAFEFCVVNNDEKCENKRSPTYSADGENSSRKAVKRKREPEDTHDPVRLNHHLDTRPTATNAKLSPGEEVDSFCLYVRDILKKLNPSLRVEAKTKIFNLMAQYELKNL